MDPWISPLKSLPTDATPVLVRRFAVRELAIPSTFQSATGLFTPTPAGPDIPWYDVWQWRYPSD